MKLIGFILVIAGSLCLVFYALYHIVVFLISGTPLLLKAGVLFIILGFVFLVVSALFEKRRKKAAATKQL
jgi:hypothetical protein